MNVECAGRLFFAFLSLSIVASCSAVLEDRRACPCALYVEMKDLSEYPVRLYVNGTPAGEATCDTTLLVRVEKGPEAAVLALSGAAPDASGQVRIPYGSQCPPLYVYAGTADCSGDIGHLFLSSFMTRHFSTLSLRFGGAAGGRVPFSAAVRGCVGGVSLPGGEPVAGDFRCVLSPDFLCRLPRQRPEDPLWLDIMLEDGVVRSFPLDVCLREAAFDWEAPQLEDISLQVNLSVTDIRFTLGRWGSSFPLQISI